MKLLQGLRILETKTSECYMTAADGQVAYRLGADGEKSRERLEND
jgi:hypothetical protein